TTHYEAPQQVSTSHAEPSRLQTGVRKFGPSLLRWGLAKSDRPYSTTCELLEQTDLESFIVVTITHSRSWKLSKRYKEGR
ncbi:hypothetical protein LSAT2_009482, partial [Lamellibrachia satsuma]